MPSNFFLLMFCAIVFVNGKRIQPQPPNNVCKTFADYPFLPTSPNCWYNPDVSARAPDLVERHGYPLQIYEAITKDNYILTVFRIPPKTKKPKGIIFFQHPALCSSTVYLDLGNDSIAFLAHNAGFDVWLGNFRGTIYSPKNVYLSQEKEPDKYWNFSFHEMGIYDLPAQIDVVRKVTKYTDKIYYIGHSVATSAAFIYASLLPDHAKENVILFTCWSPMVHMAHGRSILKVTVPFSGLVMMLAKATGNMETPTYTGLIHRSMEDICKINILVCIDVYEMMFGPDHENVNPEWLPILVHQSMAGFPVKATVHNDQIMRAKGRFQWFDYGIENENYYNSTIPPAYPIANITVPMYLVYGDRDIMAVGEDVIHVYNELPENVRFGIRKIKGYDHMDFQYGRGIRDILYLPTLRLIKRMQMKTKV